MSTNLNVSFDIYNKESVKRIQEENPDILPAYTVAESKDLAYNKKQVNNAIMSAIIQGKSIEGIADDLSKRMESLNRNSAIKAARTGITNAQNAGTLSSMKELAAMGVEVQKEWVATLDSRTRPSHQVLDGQRRELDEPFSNGLQYPGDSSGSAAEVWNCRCTIVSYLPEYDSDTNDAVRWSRNLATNSREYVPNISYSDWIKTKDEFKTLVKAGLKDYELYEIWRQLMPSDITNDEWLSLHSTYIGQFTAFKINEALRKNPELSIRDALTKEGLSNKIEGMELMERLIETHTLENDTLLIRNIDYIDGLGLQKEEIDALIQCKDNDLIAKTCSAIKGRELSEESVVSTSGSEDANFFKGRSVQLRIKATKGTRALITDNYRESEVILQRGTKYKIEEAEVKDGKDGKLVLTVIII